ncbi:MAG: hypothetical protein ABI678_17335 [Kofleriaceae bacterium]
MRDLCELTLDKGHTKRWGDVGIEFQGHEWQTADFCGLHIGPAVVNNPVPPTIVENFIDDPALARQIDVKLAAIDASKEYSYQERVAGFQLDMVLQDVRLTGRHVLVVDLHMNGCDQYPDESPGVLKQGRTITIQ